MKLIEISPFIRFAYRIIIKNLHPGIAIDNRLFYVTEGEGTVSINGKKYSYSAGTCFLWQAGTEYYLNSSDMTTLISINFDYTAKNSHLSEPFPIIYKAKNDSLPQPEKIFFDDCAILNEPVIFTGNSTIYNLLEKIIFESTSRQMYYRERVSALFKECIISIVRTVSASSDSRSDSVLETVIDYIHKNYSGNVDNQTLADLIGYHPYYLNKLFVKANGISLHRYVTNYRIAVSEQLLLSSTLTVDEIAHSIGFISSLSFSSAFKKKNGLTPTEFRKKFGATF